MPSKNLASEKPQEEETKNSPILQIVLGLIVMIGILGGALFANWDKIFPRDNSGKTHSESAPPDIRPTGNDLSMPIQEPCLKDAWEAFKRGEETRKSADFESAIKFAEKCIENLGKAADRMQEQLFVSKEGLPREGRPDNEKERDKIFARGILNDVATSYFIKGRSAEYLYRNGEAKYSQYKENAKKAYEATCQYKHALTWDPNGWFWSPCKAASDRLPIQ